MKKLGRHLIVELAECDKTILDNIVLLEEHMKESVRLAGATIVKAVFHRYNPQGVSGVVVIAESHISIHTWPEYGYAALDFFTCGDEVNPEKAYEYMARMLKCKAPEMKELSRGIPSDIEQVIAHKTLPNNQTKGNQIAANGA